MDENYLDNLLNEFSLDKEMEDTIEEELDSQMQKEKIQKRENESISREDAFDIDLERDASQIKNTVDLHFSEEQIEELDQLDDLADLDIGDGDFADIDFDDVDITKLDDIKETDLDDILKEFEGDLQINDFFDETNNEKQISREHMDHSDKDAFNTKQFPDSMLEEFDKQSNAGLTSDNDILRPLSNNEETTNDEDYVLDDLFSLLDLEETPSDEIKMESIDEETEVADTDGAEDVSGVEELHDAQKEKFMQLLFGDPDEEDELSEEELAEIDARKAAKKARKQAVRKAKKEKAKEAKKKKDLINRQKQKQNNQKKLLKAQKKTLEEKNAEPEKKLNMPMVIFIFSLFLGGTLIFYIGSSNINYTQAIAKATNYFSNQKYRSAYDEIVGVDVKEKDQELKDRIYTVMYVERLYEAYENNIKLAREEKALDSLLRGVDKYYEHYEEAEELGVASDLDYAFSKIQTELSQKYGISVEKALEMNKLDNDQYVQSIKEYVTTVSDAGAVSP